MAKETAEQKLLKVIESVDAGDSSDSGGDAYAQQVASSVKGSGMTVTVPPILESLLAKFKPASTDKTPVSFGLRELNMGFMALCVILFLLFAMDVVRGMSYAHKELSYKVSKQISEIPQNLIPQFAAMRDYLNIVSRRNIFQPYEKKEVADALADLPPETRKIQEQTQSLKLVGVSWLDSPDTATALIENTGTGVTYFLKTGDKVNEVTIKEIYADSVVVGFGSEEVNLNL